MQLWLATGHGDEGLFYDEEPLPEAFNAEGIEIRPCHWREIPADGSPVLIRTAWDYTQHRAEFLDWLDELDVAGSPVINDTDVLRWNLDKRYLLELARDGHDIVPTTTMDRFDAQAVAELARQNGWAEAVAKPIVGGGAEGLTVVSADGIVRTFEAAGNVWAPDAPTTPVGPCLVQPMLPEIEAGEWSLFFFGGGYSHAILKRPAPGDIRVQEEHGGITVAATPPDFVLAAAQDIVSDVPGAIYGRVDGVVSNGRFLLMELELIEPELYFRYSEDGAARFAAAISAALQA